MVFKETDFDFVVLPFFPCVIRTSVPAGTVMSTVERNAVISRTDGCENSVSDNESVISEQNAEASAPTYDLSYDESFLREKNARYTGYFTYVSLNLLYIRLYLTVSFFVKSINPNRIKNTGINNGRNVRSASTHVDNRARPIISQINPARRDFPEIIFIIAGIIINIVQNPSKNIVNSGMISRFLRRYPTPITIRRNAKSGCDALWRFLFFICRNPFRFLLPFSHKYTLFTNIHYLLYII